MNRVLILPIAGVCLILIGLAAFRGKPDVTNIADDQRRASDRRVTDRLSHNSVADGGAAEPVLVGRNVCRECHAENFALHAQHGHASTFHRVSETDLADTFGGRSFDAGESFGTYHYHADDQGRLFVSMPERFDQERFPLMYALGSGHNAQTLMTLTTSVDGQTEGIEHRVSCYAGERLGLTPGHANKTPRDALEYFGDSSRGQPLQRCIYCHTTSAKIVDESIVDLVSNVNCEKCHGPGSEHVRAARESSTPPPYSVGRSTWDAESELQLCGDCHRLPRSVSEKQIRDYPQLLARFQPIGMVRSACYLESKRELRCTTCHNPHRSIHTVDRSQHEQTCVNCHRHDSAGHVVCPVSPETGCVDCHMPAVELDQGLTFHDHWIRVH
ncbi:multiheme c-type cytochrome [Stieleria maiorica]|uniref:multiheme c-type cytochrome n=1 Tax=Stieleria maiorica TaxID=2795974 RepID=UPI001F273669|nr:multiheme c-type cytochrome [Stieleria maiorica]